ncbi:uncharacterized protein [Triticum aestivum]|uniref:uncharacterized protein n=1 Tax=Triticum aestivum TaxID=4565 RepID=UPI001D02D6FA|nr:uncharacterized protein LOC123040501 [Triticum aestivum]
MGDTSRDSGIEKLCESMQRMISQLMEQAQTKTSSTSEILKTLEPNPVRLTGPGDFFSWSRNATLILESHGLQKFLKDDEKKPTDVTQEQWDQNQKRVMVWLLGSMEKTVREQVEGFQSTAEVWTSIEKQFSGKSNKMQVSRIFHELRQIKQEQKTVTEFAGEIKKLYRDLEYFRPFKAHDPRDVPLLREWFEPLLVQTFLDGLNSEFNLHSQLIQATADWPTLDLAISSILEEETRLANQITTSQTNVDSRAALSSVKQIQSPGTSRNEQANATRFDYTRKPKMVCDHCKKPGHLKKSCFDIVGYPPGWQPKQFNRFTSGGSNARRPDRAHLTLFGGERSAVTAQALEEFKGKLMANTSEGPAEATSDAHSGKGSEDKKKSWDWN